MKALTRNHNFYFILILIFATVSRCYLLYHFDEFDPTGIYRLFKSKMWLNGEIHLGQGGANAPLYFIYLAGLIKFFDSPAIISRFFSLIFSIITLAQLFRLSKYIFGKTTAFITLVCASIFSLYLAYSISSTEQALFILLQVSSIFYLIRYSHENKNKDFIKSLILLFLAITIRYEGFIYLLITILFLAKKIRFTNKYFWSLAGVILLCSLFPNQLLRDRVWGFFSSNLQVNQLYLFLKKSFLWIGLIPLPIIILAWKKLSALQRSYMFVAMASLAIKTLLLLVSIMEGKERYFLTTALLMLPLAIATTQSLLPKNKKSIAFISGLFLILFFPDTKRLQKEPYQQDFIKIASFLHSHDNDMHCSLLIDSSKRGWSHYHINTYLKCLKDPNENLKLIKDLTKLPEDQFGLTIKEIPKYFILNKISPMAKNFSAQKKYLSSKLIKIFETKRYILYSNK